MTLKVLVACEESQTVCKAFRELGHEAYSNDIIECSGGHPEWHLQMSALQAWHHLGCEWDLIIAHPPCTYMSKAGARWMYPKAGQVDNARLEKALKAKEFFMFMLYAPARYIAVENPVPLKIVGLPKESQTIQPYEYGHPYSKKTLLWLQNLPPLKPTNILTNYYPYLPSNTGGAKRGQKATYRNINQKEASKTFPGIAKAMAEQWSEYIINEKTKEL